MDGQFAYTMFLGHKEFEHLIARLLRRDGWSNVQVMGGANDRGADVVASTGNARVVVQCKHYKSQKVGSKEMQQFLGMVFGEHGATVPVFVTSNQFTREAKLIGDSHGIHLISGQELARWQAFGPPPYLRP